MYESIKNKVKLMLDEDEVIDKYSNIYLNGSEEDKLKNKAMLFIGDPSFNSREWIEKAFNDFNSKDEFEAFRKENVDDPVAICMIVKAFRNLRKKRQPTDPELILKELKWMI